MKLIFAALAMLALISTIGPVDAHDIKSLHFHDQQLSHENGTLHFHGDQLSGQDKNQCFHNCIEQNGETAKSSCALQCGLAKSPGAGGKARDCGTEYKTCKKACDKDKACKEQCRAQRTSCI